LFEITITENEDVGM